LEVTTPAIVRYAVRPRDAATSLAKDWASATRWPNLDLRKKRNEAQFRSHLDALDRAVSCPLDDDATMRNPATWISPERDGDGL